jgi:predicted ATPase
MDDAPPTPSPAPSGGGGGGRGDLLAAIRDRKNIKLRKAATAVIERKYVLPHHPHILLFANISNSNALE